MRVNSQCLKRILKNIQITQQKQQIINKEVFFCKLTFSVAVYAEHSQPNCDVIAQTKYILCQMYNAIREDTDTQALLQPPEGLNAEQQLHH